MTRHGVRIYGWTPGFCCCKMCVADDEATTCSAINLDYRNLYHHFESGCLYVKCQAALDAKAVFQHTMQESREAMEKYNMGRDRFLKPSSFCCG